MFRSTFLTGYAIFGKAVRHVTAYVDRTTGAVEFRTMSGVLAPVSLNTRWMTLRAGRNASAAKIHSDGRFSKDGPSQFAFTSNYITDKKGNLMGRQEKTTEFIKHMLAVSEGSTFRGEGDDRRHADAAIILASLVGNDS